MFGELKNNNIKSIYVEEFFIESEICDRMIILRPNLSKQYVNTGILGYDGERAWWYQRTDDNEGNPRYPEIIKQES